ncbi:MAG: redoxin domain-containing protein [Verrucomicrobiota bacterium]
MKKNHTLFHIVLTTIAAIFVGATMGNAQVKTGEKAPNFTLKDTAGQSHSLSDFAGKTVILEWTNAECPFVKKFYDNGDMQKMQAQMTNDGAVWLQIVSSAEGKQGFVTPEQGQKLRADKDMKSTAMLLDPTGKVGKMYAAKTTPHMYVINDEGVLVYQGAIDDKASANAADVAGANNYVLAAYEAVTEGKEVADATTKPYGCGVKY